MSEVQDVFDPVFANFSPLLPKVVPEMFRRKHPFAEQKTDLMILKPTIVPLFRFLSKKSLLEEIKVKEADIGNESIGI